MEELRRPTGSEPPPWFEEFLESWKGNPGYRESDCGLAHGCRYKNVAIFAPYHAYGRELCEFLLECQRRGFETFLAGESYYYPSRCFTICVYRKEDESEMEEFVAGIDTKIAVPTEHSTAP